VIGVVVLCFMFHVDIASRRKEEEEQQEENIKLFMFLQTLVAR